MSGADSTDVPTYQSAFHKTVDFIPESIKDLLSSYSGIPEAEQIPHIVRVRDDAYARAPYPCLGSFNFLGFHLSAHPAYKEHVLAPLKALRHENSTAGDKEEPLFLDLGTCFGQDLRRLAYDGAEVNRLWGSDINEELIDFGYELFRDQDRLPRDHFLCPGDLLSTSPAGDKLVALDDKVTIIGVNAVFHLFSFEDQKKAADRCLRLFRKTPGRPVLLLGVQQGSLRAGEVRRENVTENFAHKYRHNNDSWRELWASVCGTNEWKDKVAKLEINTELKDGGWHREGMVGQEVKVILEDTDTLKRRHVFEVWITFN
ncbi:hypothetical protein BX600DRAFT_475746 [Xylariales sp. PMI_506]|nr:hypothetical protein BX600DRAFT_475746 [Xylariales sp. PMI_506]